VPFPPHTVTAPTWALLTMSYGWYAPPPPPERAWLPLSGRYRVDPAQSALTASVRTTLADTARSRRLRVHAKTGHVTGLLRFGHDGDVSVGLQVEAAGLRTGDPARDRALHRRLDTTTFPLLRFTATDLAAVDGAWLLHGQLRLRGTVVPLALWLDPVHRMPDGAIALRAHGSLDRGSTGLGRRAFVEVALVAAPEPVSFAPPCLGEVGLFSSPRSVPALQHQQ
jgi:polyisoprenoid-binding protein YceI